MATVFLRGETADDILASTETTRNMAMVNSSGLTVATIKENGKMESRMGKANILQCKE
jgi:hypothetical protein